MCDASSGQISGTASSNGRTAPFEGVNAGSTPAAVTKRNHYAEQESEGACMIKAPLPKPKRNRFKERYVERWKYDEVVSKAAGHAEAERVVRKANTDAIRFWQNRANTYARSANMWGALAFVVSAFNIALVVILVLR